MMSIIPPAAAENIDQGPQLMNAGPAEGIPNNRRRKRTRWRLDYATFIELVWRLGCDHWPVMHEGARFMMEVNRRRVWLQIIKPRGLLTRARWFVLKSAVWAIRKRSGLLKFWRDRLHDSLCSVPGHEWMHLELILEWRIA